MKYSRFEVDMSVLVRAIRRILYKGESAGTEAEIKRNEIRKDGIHNQLWKDEQMGAIRAAENQAYRTLGAKVGPLFDLIWAKIDARREDVDIFDERLQSALRTLDTLGKNAPARILEALPVHFRSDPGALAILKAAYRKYDFDTSVLEKYEQPFTSLGLEREAVMEFTAYATSELTDASWKSGRVNGILSALEKSLGLNSEVNPVAKMVQDFAAGSLDRMAAARARRFLRVYGQELEADDPDAIEKGLNALEDDFKSVTP